MATFQRGCGESPAAHVHPAEQVELGARRLAGLVRHEADHHEHDRQKCEGQLPRHIVALDEGVVAGTYAGEAGQCAGRGGRIVGGELAHVTWKVFVTDAPLPLLEQVTVTGQAPGVVREPTSHVQLTAPAELAVFDPRPAAFEGPDL